MFHVKLSEYILVHSTFPLISFAISLYHTLVRKMLSFPPDISSCALYDPSLFSVPSLSRFLKTKVN